MALVCKDLDWSNSLVFPTAMVPTGECPPFVLQPVTLPMPGQLIYNSLPVTYYGNQNQVMAQNSENSYSRKCTPQKKNPSTLKNVKNLVNKSKAKRAKNVRNCVPLNLSNRAKEKRSHSDSDSELSISDSDCFISPPKRAKRQNLYIHGREMRAFFEILSKLTHC